MTADEGPQVPGHGPQPNESDMTVGEGPQVPWPGPQPYDEEDWDDFSGRDSTLEELLNRVSVDKLTVLLGASGTGKTSLIRAGLVPLLRHGRYHPFEGSQATWPVLLLRRWGAVGSNSLKKNLLLQLDSAVEAIEDWGRLSQQQAALAEARSLAEDLASVRDMEDGASGILKIVENLARAQVRRAAKNAVAGALCHSGITLVFDQFEEQLRSGRRASAEALELIGNLVRGTAPIRVLVSMRREYQYALRPLELMVGGLSSRSLFLEPLEAPDLLKVINESSKRSELPIEQEVANSIVKWLSANSSGSRDGASDGESYEESHRQAGHEEKGRPDLLQVQAVLLELCNYAAERGWKSVDREIFERFGAEFAEGPDSALPRPRAIGIDGGEAEELVEEKLARRVLGGALERWIESAIKGTTKRGRRRSRVNTRIRSHVKWADMDEPDLRLQVRRIAVRLAPRLSSGDYKVSQEDNALFRQALGGEIARLGVKDPKLRAKVRIVTDETGPPRLNWAELGLGELQAADSDAKSTLSGLARVKGWSATTAGDKILICFKETLHRLAGANILQCTDSGDENGLYWELVHDQFGPSFTRWAERQLGTWDDCKSSLVVCSGLQPIAVPVKEIGPASGVECYELLKISWQGCSVEGSAPKRLVLRNVIFKECFLVGTIFDGVEFVGSSFEDCSLLGVLFRNCVFRPDDNGRSTTFTRCDSNVAIVRSVIYDLEFRDCHLLQPTIDRTTLEGDVRYRDGCKVIQGFYDVKSAKDASIRFSPDSSAAFCTAGRDSFGFLDFSPERELNNGKLLLGFQPRTATGEQKG